VQPVSGTSGHFRLPLSTTTLSPRSTEKWRRFDAQIEQVLPIVQEAHDRARQFVRELTSAH